jgi:predicted PurR-regulated permease PerM
MNGILPIDKVSLKAEAAGYLKQLAASMLQIAGAAFGGATSSIMTGLMVLLLLYFVVRYGHSWLRAVPSLLPLEPDVTAAIFRAVHDTIIANVNGLLVVAAAQGFLLGLGFWFLGLPSPVTWGLFGALASMIPVVGIVIVWLPFVIGLALMGRYVHAGVLAAWSVLIVGTIDNVIRPLVVRGRVNQHPMLIVLAIIGGTTAFGALGLVLGPVVVSLVIALAGEIRKRLPHYVEETQTP